MNDRAVKRILAFVFIALLVLPPPIAAQTHLPQEIEPAFSREEITRMLAPIALYPDALLSQILIASAYPFEVAEADRWMTGNSSLAGASLDNALQAKDWDVSVLSLCHYPKILTMMSENLTWTANLGNAFVNQQHEVMETVQELRARADAQGNLVSTSEHTVIVEGKNIRIEPVSNNYVYVPVYDSFIVYGPWWYPSFPVIEP